MIRHIVAWNYKEGLTKAQNSENALQIKAAVEALNHCVEGIIELKVYIDGPSVGGRDLVLNSLFLDKETLAAYQIHPAHQKAAALIGQTMENRVCIDYEE